MRLVQIGHYYVRKPNNFSGKEGYPPISRTSPNDVAGLLQRTAAVTCRDQLFDKDQREACLRPRTWWHKTGSCCKSTLLSANVRCWDDSDLEGWAERVRSSPGIPEIRLLGDRQSVVNLKAAMFEA